MTDYVELHARSAFSFLEGASSPEEMAAVCAELGMPAIALLDSNGVYGTARLHTAMKRLGLRGIAGAEITAQEFGCAPFAHQRESARPDPSLGKNKNASLRMTASLPLLVESRAGYQNLCRLITKMKLRVPKHAKPGECAAREDELREHAEGLVCLTGDEHGPLAAALEIGGAAEGKRCLERLLGIFGERNLYIEVQRHYHRREEARNQAVIELARSYGLPLLATNAPRYAREEEREILDVFTCIRNHTRLDLAGKLLAKNSERHLKSPQAMAKLFADLPEAVANTKELSERLQFSLTDLGYEFPKYPVPAGETMASFLRKRTEEGARAVSGACEAPPVAAGAAADRTRVGIDHQAWPGRIFSDRLGHGPILPRRRDSGAGAGLGGKQRCLLFAQHHGGRPDRDGPAVRTVPFRGAR